MRLPLFTLLASFLLSLICAARPASTPPPLRFEFKNDGIEFKINGNDCRIKSELFRSVLDWSDDYSRENTGTGKREGRFFIFRGALNNDRDIVFIYDLGTRKLTSVANGGGVIVDDRLGWAALQYDPKFAGQTGLTSIILNGEKVGAIESAKLKGIEFHQGTLHIVVAPHRGQAPE